MAPQSLLKADLVKRINYHNIFQEVVAALPKLCMDRAGQLTAPEIQTIMELNGNITLIAIAITRAIQQLYKALPEYADVKGISTTAYSTFLYNAIHGLLAIDERLLKPPLIRLFGEGILVNNEVNEADPLYPYVKYCGANFIALCKMPMQGHWAEAVKEDFLCFSPYRNKNVSFDFQRLIYLPIIKPLGVPSSKNKWQLHYFSSNHYSVPVDCMAEKSSDRYKVFYEDPPGLIEGAKSAISKALADLKQKSPKPALASGDMVTADSLKVDFGFKAVVCGSIDNEDLLDIREAFTHIQQVLGKIADLINQYISLEITAKRKSSLFDRSAMRLIVNVEPKYYDAKLGYVYGQAVDRVMAKVFYKKSNYLASEYWYLVDTEEDEQHQSLRQIFKSLGYTVTPRFNYASSLLDGLIGKHFFAHPAECFARALAAVISQDTANGYLQLDVTGHRALLFLDDDELAIVQLAIDNVESKLAVIFQNDLFSQ